MQDNKQPVKPIQSASGLVPDIVKEIPLASPGGKLRSAGNDDELDNIMRDVSHDLKKVGQKKTRDHWFTRRKKPKAKPKFSARPIDQARPLHAAPAPKPAQVPLAAKPADAKTKLVKTSRAPVGVIAMAMLATVGLIAAAYFAYR